MAVKAIRYWLMRRPRPTFVRCVVGKEISEMQFDARTSFARTAESLEAMDADRLEALDQNRALIRACKPGEMDEPEAAEAEPEEAPPPPAGAVATDPETARFVLVANLISEAYKHSTEVAFSRLADIVDRMTRRTESSERTIESLRRHLLAEAQERYENGEAKEPGLIEQLAGAFAGGVALKQDAAPTPPNGKGHS